MPKKETGKEKGLPSESTLLIEQFKKVRQEFIDTINKIPENKREKTFLGSWTLKDILAHMTGWGIHQISVLEKLQNNISPDYSIDTTTFNDNSVSLRKEWGWNRAHNEFLNIGEQLIAKYENLPGKLWRRKIWQDKKLTPCDLFKIEIKHYQTGHLPQIKEFIGTT